MSKIMIDVKFTGKWHNHTLEQTETVVNTMTDEEFIGHLAGQGVTQASIVSRSYPAYAWPGGYQMAYLVKDGGILCPECATQPLGSDPDSWVLTIDAHDAQFFIVDAFINYENQDLGCDHCNRKIPAAYGNDDEVDELPTQPADLAD